MKCARCGQEFEPEFKTNICGNCADDLREEEAAYNAQEEAAYQAKEAQQK